MPRRLTIDAGDVPADKAAFRMGLTLSEFEAVLPRLYARGFPMPDPDTGNFDLQALDAWRAARHKRAYQVGLTPVAANDDAGRRAEIERRKANARS